MKSFLIALLVLAGCAETPIQPVAPEIPLPVIVARGTDGLVDYSCTVEELNDKLVWIPCEFHNRNPAIISSCIKVTFYSEMTLTPVAESRKICSGLLGPNETKINYAAFIKEKRAALQRCGELLGSCVMLAGHTQESEIKAIKSWQ
jgi:hypothetical protein